jgi:hypothetical protein
LLIVLTLKKQGVSRLAQGVGISVFILAQTLALFVVGSGWADALRPYTSTTSSYPYITVNAFNFWYAITLGQGNRRLDEQPLIGVFTYKQMGLALLAIFTVWMCITMWRQADKPRLFLWAGTLFFAFFMLPTEIHERYLYPATVLIVLAAAKEHRLLVIGLGLAITFSLNLLMLTEPLQIFLWMLHPTDVMSTLFASYVNVVLFLALLLIVYRLRVHSDDGQPSETVSV